MAEGIVPRLDRDRLSVPVALILLIGVLFRFIDLPEVSRSLNVLGSPLGIHVNRTVLLVVLVGALVAMGTRYVLAAHPTPSERLPRPRYLSWVLPTLLGGLAAYLIELAPTAGVWLVSLAGGVLVIALAMAAEFGSLSIDDPNYARSRLALNILGYLLAFFLFYLIYRTRARSILTASGVTLVAFLVALDLLSVADVGVGRVALHAAAVALLAGEATWALNYWRLSNWAASLALLVTFYLVTGITHQHLFGRLNRLVLLEFGLVAVLALCLILFFVP